MGWLKGKQQAKKASKQKRADTPIEDQTVKEPSRFSEWSQARRDAITMRARSSARYIARWRIMSGGPDCEIDFNNPQIRLEWELCDIDNLRLIYKGRHTSEFLDHLPPECRTLYYQKDPDGKTYAETVENPRFFIGFLKGLGILRRGNQKELEELLKQIDEQEKAENET